MRKQLHKADILAHKKRLKKKDRIAWLKQVKLLYDMEHKESNGTQEESEF